MLFGLLDDRHGKIIFLVFRKITIGSFCLESGFYFYKNLVHDSDTYFQSFDGLTGDFATALAWLMI